MHVVDTYELSPMQEGMLFHAVRGGHPGIDVGQVLVTLREPWDDAHFLRAWSRVAARHPVLRSQFRWQDVAQPVQEVVDGVEIPVQQFDWRALAESERDRRLRALLDHELVRGFDVRKAPLMRLVFVRTAGDEHRVLWTFHHILLDGRSFPRILREVFTLYEAFSRGAEADFPSPRPYRDFIESLREMDYGAGVTYWQAALAGFRAPTRLPVARDGEAVDIPGIERGAHEIRLSAALTAALRELAREASVRVSSLLQGAWALLLHRYSGETDIVFGATRDLRESLPEGGGDMIGLMINTLPKRVHIHPGSELVPYLQERRAYQLETGKYRLTPLVQVQDRSEVPRGVPLFESILVFQEQTLDAQLRELGGAWSERRFEYRGQTSFALTLMAYADRELLLRLEYSRRRFADEVVARMLGHLQVLLEGMVANPGARLKDLPILGEAERRQLLVEWNATRSGYAGDALVQGAFEAQAQRGARRTALRVGKAALSYGELEARANRLAQALRARGVGRGQRVGVCLERGAEMLAAVLGILKAGAAYVPLDPSFPQERLRFMAEDAQLALLVSSAALAGAFGLPRERQLLLDADAGSIASAPEAPLPADALGAQPADPAYVIYTSGSTGKPKGVVVPHRAVVNFLASMAREPGLGADDVLVAVTTLSFDIAVLELQLPLAVGATVVMASRDEAIDGRALRALLEQSRATVLQATPVTWRLLLEAGWSGGGTRFKALVGGEALPRDLADQLLARGVELWNMYGPTETTVWSTCARISGTANGISIGKPIANTVVRVLDAQGNLCPIGVPGELCIGGDGLSLGYWNRPELTAERFIPDPFGAGPAATLYRTGDRARWRDDGTLEHLGRLDFQVKLRGYRIELGEIEAGIARHPAVREAVVVAREDVPGDKRLVAYLVTENPPADLVEQLRALVRASMPEYMLPAHFVSVDALPLTPNGKIDRKSLPPPQAAGAAPDARAYLAPRNDLEISLATAWEKVLGVARVGIQDNFFELGGNSLSVLRLIFEMKQASGIEIALGDVFRSPTIAGLITHLSPDAVKDASVVVPLQPQGDGLPIFCICGINIYKDFAQSLGKSQPVFGVYVEEEQAIIDQVLSGDTPTISIKQLVDAYDKAIARFRPQGPYRLAGLSFGGVLAMELASKLRRRGEQVDLVFLLDTMLPEGWHRNWAKWLSRQVAEFMTGKSRAKLLRLYARLQDRILKQPAQPRVRNRAKHMDEMFRQRQGAAFLQASAQWQADQSVVDFPVVLFRASEHSLSSDIEIQEDYGWRRYLGERLSIVDVSGGHISIIEPPNVADLASKAQRYLNVVGSPMKHGPSAIRR